MRVPVFLEYRVGVKVDTVLDSVIFFILTCAAVSYQ